MNVSEASVVRPSLGLLFFGAVAAWGNAMVVEHVTWLHYVGKEPSWTVAVVLVLFLTASLLAGARRKNFLGVLTILAPVLVLATCVSACSLLYWFSWESSVGSVSAAVSGGAGITVDLLSDPSLKDYGMVSEGKVLVDGRSVRVRVKWPQDEQGLFAGHCIVASGSFRAPADDEGGRWNHQQGFAGMLNVRSCEEKGYADGLRGWVTPLRDSSFERVKELGGNASGLLAGILLGNRTLYSGTELEQDFRVTGLAHLMAVSGTHLAVVTALSLWVLRCLPLGRRTRSVTLACLLFGYVALTAFAPSALRACGMCLVALGASRFGRRKHIVSALSACVVVFLALEPRLAFSLSFQLSVLCMVGLVLFTPLAAAWVECLLPRNPFDLSQGLAATLCATLMTMPVTIPLFYQLPLVSPLSTLAVSPLICAALSIGVVGLIAGAVIEPLGSVLLHLAGTVSELASGVVHGLASLPFVCVPLDASAPWLSMLDVVVLIALWIAWPLPGKNKARHLPVAAACLTLPVALVLVAEFGGLSACVRAAGLPVSSDAQVIMLDVGQGDAMVIRDGNSAILVDTGEEGTVLLKALARNGIKNLNAVALSHKDVDHTGALSSLTGVVGIDQVLIHRDLVGDGVMSAVTEATGRVTRGKAPEGVGVGTTLKVGRFTLKLLAPVRGGSSENEDSLIWLLSFDEDGDGVAEAKGLLTGDGEQEAIEGIVQSSGDISFLKVAHHGSKGAVSPEELEVLKPELALISVGADNKYGHPTQETLDVLKQVGCSVRRTDLSGDITLSFKGRSIGVKTQRGGR